jgi:hypothetical protein
MHSLNLMASHGITLCLLILCVYFSACVYTTLKSFDSLPMYITHKNRQPTYIITMFICNTCCPLCEVKVLYVCSKFITKVKQSRNRPGVAQRVPGGLGSTDFHDILHMKVVSLSASRTGRLYPQEMFLALIFTRG